MFNALILLYAGLLVGLGVVIDDEEKSKHAQYE